MLVRQHARKRDRVTDRVTETAVLQITQGGPIYLTLTPTVYGRVVDVLTHNDDLWVCEAQNGMNVVVRRPGLRMSLLVRALRGMRVLPGVPIMLLLEASSPLRVELALVIERDVRSILECM